MITCFQCIPVCFIDFSFIWKTKDILPSVDTILKIAAALNVSVEWLLSDSADFEKNDENIITLHNLSNLSEDKKEIINDMLNKLIKLEHLEQVSKK